MKEIQLTQNKVVLVDDEDFAYLNQYKWRVLKGRNTFYAMRHKFINGKDTNVYMHREIMGLNKYNNLQIDHRDHNGLNNQKYNLRKCNNIQNGGNQNKQYNNTSGYKEVFWHKHSKKWRVQIMNGNKIYYGGYFKDVIEAAKAYDKKARELFGEFAKTNFINISDWT